MIYIYTDKNNRSTLRIIALLTLLDYDFKEFILNEHFSLEALQRIAPSAKLLPQVFMDSDLIGDAKDTFTYFSKLTS